MPIQDKQSLGFFKISSKEKKKKTCNEIQIRINKSI